MDTEGVELPREEISVYARDGLSAKTLLVL
jgi:hypothetical protein